MCDLEFCDGNLEYTPQTCFQCKNAICDDCLFGLLKYWKLPEDNDEEGDAIGCYCPFCREVLVLVGDWNHSELQNLTSLMTSTNNSTLRLESATNRPNVIEISWNRILNTNSGALNVETFIPIIGEPFIPND